MNKYLKYLFYITLVLLFLPAFAFPLAGRAFRVYFIFLLLFYGCILCFNFKSFYKNIVLLYKKTPFKYLMFFIAYLFISTIFTYIKNVSLGNSSLLYIIQFTILYAIPTFLLSALFIRKYMSMKKFIKIYFIALFLIFSFGLIEFFGGKILNIEFINIIQQFIANERLYTLDAPQYMDRLQSVFAEPGWLGVFTFLNFPIIYKCAESKYKIFENKYINKFIKKTIVPLAWSNIIFSMSPIWLIFCLIQALFIFRKKIIKVFFNVKTLIFSFITIVVLFIMLLIILFLFEIKIESSQMIRIVNTISNFLNFRTLLFAEPSLGARLVSYIALVRTFFEHPILGVGLNNAQYYVGNIITKYSIPMTFENFANYKIYLNTGSMQVNASYLYTLLAETGIIGTILYFIFIAKTIKYAKKLRFYINDTILKDYTNGLFLSMCCYCFLSIYGTVLTIPYNWFFFGIIIAIYISCNFAEGNKNDEIEK